MATKTAFLAIFAAILAKNRSYKPYIERFGRMTERNLPGARAKKEPFVLSF